MNPLEYILDIEITNRCNARCQICPRSELERPLGDMSNKTFELLAERISHSRTKHVVFSGFGEPLLHPMLPEYVRRLRREVKGRIQVNTNAMALTQDLSSKLVETGLDVLNISYNGPDREAYEQIMRGMQFERLKRNLEQFLEVRGGRKKPVLSLQSLLGVEIVRLYGFNNRAGLLPYPEKGGRVPMADRFCYDKVMIAWDGTIYPCSHDIKGMHPLGNLLDAGFDAIQKEDYPMCANCTICDQDENKRYKVWKNVLRHKMLRVFR
ncbi:MAG: radical SAM protein [Deltaproteobacteria bacterium]|nr:radical SAM protein [Deltaproteobacteria bacterium]